MKTNQILDSTVNIYRKRPVSKTGFIVVLALSALHTFCMFSSGYFTYCGPISFNIIHLFFIPALGIFLLLLSSPWKKLWQITTLLFFGLISSISSLGFYSIHCCF